MAMYEDRGYCPKTAFVCYQLKEEMQVSATWEEVKEMLGDRIFYMYYPQTDVHSVPYVVEAIEGAKGLLGLMFAATLKKLIPVCRRRQSGKPIICHDLINQHQLPIKMEEGLWGDWRFANEKDYENATILQDERFLIVIVNGKSEVNVYLVEK